MAVNHHVSRRPLDNRGLDFFDEVPMIVTSSPIERHTANKRTAKHRQLKSDPTWCSVLQEYYSTPESMTSNSDASSTSTTNGSSGSFQPVLEHRLRFAIEDNKVQLLSQSKKVLSEKAKQSKETALEVPEHLLQQEKHKLDKISANIKSRNVTIDEVLKYEELLKQQFKAKDKAPERRGNGDPISFIEKELGNLNVTPKTSKIIEKRKREQERRLISLINSKKKATIHSRHTLDSQLRGTEDEVIKIMLLLTWIAR